MFKNKNVVFVLKFLLKSNCIFMPNSQNLKYIVHFTTPVSGVLATFTVSCTPNSIGLSGSNNKFSNKFVYSNITFSKTCGFYKDMSW